MTSFCNISRKVIHARVRDGRRSFLREMGLQLYMNIASRQDAVLAEKQYTCFAGLMAVEQAALGEDTG